MNSGNFSTIQDNWPSIWNFIGLCAQFFELTLIILGKSQDKLPSIWNFRGLLYGFFYLEKNVGSCLNFGENIKCLVNLNLLSQAAEKAVCWKLLWKLTCDSWFDSACCCNMIAEIANILKNWGCFAE